MATATAAEDNPKSYVATASGANVALAAVTDQTYFISSITFAATHESTAVVAVYVTSGDRNVIGTSTARIPIDKTGIAGYAGITITHENGFVAAGKKGEAITINLSAAQPVIVQITYVLR
jgi:hypothetical protein